jgi:hypothetical protein
MNVKILKLITGEEIMAEVKNSDSTSITVKNAVAVMLQPTQEGYGFGFVPWCPLAGETKTINRTALVFEQDPNDEAINAYSSMFSSIITPVSNRKLIV